MKRFRLTEEQIIGILREHESGATTANMCRRYGASSATFYKSKAQYGGLEVSEAKRLKALEDEHGRLRQMLADGRSLRTLCLVDNCTRKYLALLALISFLGQRVARMLENLVQRQGRPGVTVSKNGTEQTLNAILGKADKAGKAAALRQGFAPLPVGNHPKSRFRSPAETIHR